MRVKTGEELDEKKWGNLLKSLEGAVRVSYLVRMNAQNSKLAVDLPTAAEMCSVSRRTLENFISAKLLPSRKIGKRRVILVRDLESFLRRDQPCPLVSADGFNASAAEPSE